MFPPDVIQFNMACMTMQTENADELKELADTLITKYADQPDVIAGILRNVDILDYRADHDKKNDSRPDHRIFTPLIDDERAQLYLSDHDHDKVTRGPGYKGIVTDIDTGKRYHVYGAPCSEPSCYCDAVAKEIGA